MSWLSNLVETYDRVADIAGISHGEGSGGYALWPLYHMAAKTGVCVTLDGGGNFRRAEASEERIIIPYTEDSASRSGAIVAPHPLHDQLGYLASNADKLSAYLDQLEAWHGGHPKVAAVYKYALGGTLLDDLRGAGIKADDEKLFIRFRVEIPGDLDPNLWEDARVAKAWQTHYSSAMAKAKTLCYVSGFLDFPAGKHLKGVNPAANGAKLISCNDEANYTYRGRFSKAEQANSIGTESSHKAHAMLNYLITTQGYRRDTQAVVAWAIEDGQAQASPFADSLDIYGAAGGEDDKLAEARGSLAFDYAANLRRALYGSVSTESLSNFARRVSVMAVDAATTGRMGITFYQELYENEYIERIIKWHETCRWHFYSQGADYICAPAADRIIAAVYGEPKGDGYKKIQKQARERLLRSIVCGERIDRGWVTAAARRVSSPFSYEGASGSWSKGMWQNALRVTCAVARKYYNDKYEKEEFSLELDKTCNERSYLFGRLLAIADKLESHARLRQAGKDDTEKRPTNAVRYMTAFSTKPARTWLVIYTQINPYIQRLNGAEGYQRNIDEIMSLFDPGDYSDGQLDATYLIGYSLQRREMSAKKSGAKTNEGEEANEHIEED